MATSHGFNLTEATTSVSAPVQVSSGLQVIVGTAPVNQLANPEAAVNTPLYLSTYKEAVAAVGWSDDFAKYTLCEAISANFQVMGTAPIVVINVLDPGKHTTPLDATTVQVNDGVAQINKTGLLLKKLVVKKDTTAPVSYTHLGMVRPEPTWTRRKKSRRRSCAWTRVSALPSRKRRR